MNSLESPLVRRKRRRRRPKSSKCSFFGEQNWFILPYTCTLSFVNVIILWTHFSPKNEDVEKRTGTPGEIITVSIVLAFQGIVLLTTFYNLMRDIKHVTIIEVFAVFFSKVVFFGTAYSLCYIVSTNRAFHHPAWFTVQTYPNVILSFMYYSMSCQTLVGQSDIWPAQWSVELMSAVQYILGVLYSVFTISQAVDSLTQREKRHKLRKTSWWRRNVVNNPAVKGTRRQLRKIVCPLVLVVEVAKCIYFSKQDGNVFTTEQCKTSEFVVFLLLDILLLLVITSTSTKVIRWNHQNRDVSICFLVQSYLASALIFGGLYLDIQAYGTQGDSPFLPETRGKMIDGKEGSYAMICLEFMHFSFATQTAVGQSGNVSPRKWSAYFLIMVQMAHSFLFHTYIFGLGLIKIRTNRLDVFGKNKGEKWLRAMGAAHGTPERSSSYGSIDVRRMLGRSNSDVSEPFAMTSLTPQGRKPRAKPQETEYVDLGMSGRLEKRPPSEEFSEKALFRTSTGNGELDFPNYPPSGSPATLPDGASNTPTNPAVPRKRSPGAHQQSNRPPHVRQEEASSPRPAKKASSHNLLPSFASSGGFKTAGSHQRNHSVSSAVFGFQPPPTPSPGSGGGGIQGRPPEPSDGDPSSRHTRVASDASSVATDVLKHIT